MLRTMDEVAAHVAEHWEQFFDFEGEVCVGYLPYEYASPYVRDGVTAEQWAEDVAPYTEERLRADMAAYMEFAWGKAENHRGLSASRSVSKIRAWVWLLGDEAVLHAMDTAPYPGYGAPKLAAVCRAYDLPIPQSAAVQNMIQGLKCRPDCDGGCED